MEKFDVVIIGAGPAGLSAAKILGEAAKKVVVFEKNREIGPKVCAGGLTLRNFQIGVPRSLIERSFDCIRVHLYDKLIEIKEDKSLVATVDRRELGQWMKKQIEGMVDIKTETRVVEIKDNSVVLENGREVGFDYLIGADGSLSLVRRHLGLPTKKVLTSMHYLVPRSFESLEVFLNPDLFGFGYAWIFPHKDYSSIGCGSDLGLGRKKELQKNFHAWLKKRKIDVSNAKFESFPINFDYRGFIFRNKFLVGDAAGFASGLSGEGVYRAIVSGQEVAKKILDPDYNIANLKNMLRRKFLLEKSKKILLLIKNERMVRMVFKKLI